MKNLFATAASVLVLGFAMPAMAQSSTSNVAQAGYYNGVLVDQIGTGAVNKSFINQGQINGISDWNGATVDQNGINVLENTSTIDQDGSHNTATVTQGGNGAQPGLTNDYNKSSVDQDGTSNIATVMQGNLATNNDSWITQLGTLNWATVDQGGAQGQNDGPNWSDIDQTGYSNEAHVAQGGSGALNTSLVTQHDTFGFGGDNYANVDQRGSSDNDSSIDQNGALNTANVNQNSAVNVSNISILTQLGLSNSAIVNQH